MKRRAGESGTHVDELGDGPNLGIVLDDTTLSEEGDLDGMDAWLPSEHALDGL